MSADGARARSWWLPHAGVAVAAAALLAYVYDAPPYTPDSWSYLELARTFGDGFYRIDTFRSFVTEEPFSAAFPPAWPGVIALVDAVTGLGFRSGLVAAFAATGAAAMVLEAAGRRAGALPGTGALVVTGLLLYDPFVEDLAAGGNMPLVLCLLGLLALAVMRGTRSLGGAAVAGLVAGALVMTRFDLLLPMALFAVALAATRRLSFRGLLVFGAGLAVAVSPWVVYSLDRFGTPFATDNARIATAAEEAFVLDYLPPDAPTIADDPGGWAGKVLDHLVELAETSVEAVVLAAFGASLLVAAWLLRRGNGRERVPPPDGVRALVWLGAALLAGNVVSVGLTGYAELRYVVPWLAVALLVAWTLGTSRLGFGRAVPVVGLAAALVAAGAFAFGSTPASIVLGAAGSSHDIRLEDPTEGLDAGAVEACRTPSDVLLLPDETLAFKAGALEGWRIVLVPSNWEELSVADRRDFLEGFRPTVVAPEFGVRNPDEAAGRLVEDLAAAGWAVRPCAGGAWRLSSASPQS
ncbi:MAG TPA: hypothetical protein VHN37_15320 [Actinomycetota bacterium]|nr:hypothetical protein [Actinomycetota bacterium]